MSRVLRSLVLLLFVAACGGGEQQFSAPRDLDNACSIVAQRPNYLRAFQATERKWGVPVAVQMAIMYQESKFIGNARTPHRYALGVIPVGRQSSAFGYSQALDGTWAEYQAQQGGNRTSRDNIADATDFMGWYMNLTLRELGIPLNDTRNQYLAYHEGRAGFRRGSYNDKAWLVRIAGRLHERATMYDAQLRSCGRI
ncbi:MAG: transglycosylase SLT domain-containing protein [Rubellimicrobium sp.]|nr:transglycosylase SLT domain-containing protein [Rubellimicrobium sp.]